MREPDQTFFDEYKKLDNLCEEVFSCQNGISEYIEQMEQEPRGEKRIPTWTEDYKNLKHWRWLRNRLAHDSVDGGICKQADITALKAFYRRVQVRQDPISLLHKGKHFSLGEKKRGAARKWRLFRLNFSTGFLCGVIVTLCLVYYFSR